MPPATSAWTRKSAPSVGSTVVEAGSLSATGSAPKRSVLYRFVRSTSFAGVAAPTVMIVCAAADRAVDGRGGDDLAVERDRSGPVDVRRS